MGFKIDKTEVINSLNRNDLTLIFRKYDRARSNLDGYFTYVTSPEKGDCFDSVEIILDTEFTTVASDTSDLDDVMAFMTRLISLTAGGMPSPGVIVNKVKDGYETLKKVIEREQVPGTPVTLNLPIEPCDTDEVVILATLLVEARGKVSNATQEADYNPNDPGQAFARLNLKCDIGSDDQSSEFLVGKTDAERGSLRTYGVRNAHLLRNRRVVDVAVNSDCRVTDVINWFDEIAALAISQVKLIIEVVPPEMYRRRFSDAFLDYLHEAGVAIPAPATPREEAAQKKMDAKKAAKAKEKQK